MNSLSKPLLWSVQYCPEFSGHILHPSQIMGYSFTPYGWGSRLRMVASSPCRAHLLCVGVRLSGKVLPQPLPAFEENELWRVLRMALVRFAVDGDQYQAEHWKPVSGFGTASAWKTSEPAELRTCPPFLSFPFPMSPIVHVAWPCLAPRRSRRCRSLPWPVLAVPCCPRTRPSLVRRAPPLTSWSPLALRLQKL